MYYVSSSTNSCGYYSGYGGYPDIKIKPDFSSWEIYDRIEEEKRMSNEIKKVKVIHSYSSRIDDTTDIVIVTFTDGKSEKSIHKPDGYPFDLKMGISLCVAKHACGGSSKFYNIVDKGVDIYNKDEKDKEKAKKEKMLRRFENDENIKKKAKKKMAERTERVSEMTEAFLDAIRIYNTSEDDEDEE